MKWLNNRDRYGILSISLHWIIALLFVAVYASIELRELFPKGSDPRQAMKTWHFMLGLSIWVLIWPRLWLMFHGRFPAIRPEPPRWQQRWGRGMHIALYGLMIVMPLSGWAVIKRGS